jgi:hypothetical protein
MSDQEQLDQAWADVQSGLEQEDQGHKRWIKGTLALIQILDNGRRNRNHIEFSRWLNEMGYGVDRISRPDRQALLNMAINPTITREVLEQTTRRSWIYIWSEEVRPRVHYVMQEERGTEIPIEEVTRYPSFALSQRKRYDREEQEKQERLQQEQLEQERAEEEQQE